MGCEEETNIYNWTDCHFCGMIRNVVFYNGRRKPIKNMAERCRKDKRK